VAPSFGAELSSIDVRNAPEIERAVTAFAHGSNGDLIVLSSATGVVHRELIITLAARHRLPATYPSRLFVTGGGLISYGPDVVDQPRLAAGYVDRISRARSRETFRCRDSFPAELRAEGMCRTRTIPVLNRGSTNTARSSDRCLPIRQLRQLWHGYCVHWRCWPQKEPPQALITAHERFSAS
jgi:hypothetical protein